MFIPAVTGHSPFGDLGRDLVALSTRMDGMGIITCPIRMCTFEFSPSNKATVLYQSFAIPSAISDWYFSK